MSFELTSKQLAREKILIIQHAASLSNNQMKSKINSSLLASQPVLLGTVSTEVSFRVTQVHLHLALATWSMSGASNCACREQKLFSCLTFVLAEKVHVLESFFIWEQSVRKNCAPCYTWTQDVAQPCRAWDVFPPHSCLAKLNTSLPWQNNCALVPAKVFVPL